MPGKWPLFSALGVAIAVGAGTFVALRHNTPAPQRSEAQVRAVEPDLLLPAKLQPNQSLSVGVPLEGRIEALHAEVGADVYEGQLLAQIRSESSESEAQAATLDLERAQSKANQLDSSIAGARLEASRASAESAQVRSELDRATRHLQRQKLLLAEGATPRLTFEKAEKDHSALEAESKTLDAAARQAEERVANLQSESELVRKHLEAKVEELEQTNAQVAAGEIYSPATGTVTARRGQPGEQVDPSWRDLFQIAVDLSTMEAVVEPSPDQLSRIKAGQSATLMIAESVVPLSGTVKRVENGKAIIEFANPSPLIKPGMSAQVRIKLT